jgi:hypothetical protein
MLQQHRFQLQLEQVELQPQIRVIVLLVELEEVQLFQQ